MCLRRLQYVHCGRVFLQKLELIVFLLSILEIKVDSLILLYQSSGCLMFLWHSSWETNAKGLHIVGNEYINKIYPLVCAKVAFIPMRNRIRYFVWRWVSSCLMPSQVHHPQVHMVLKLFNSSQMVLSLVKYYSLSSSLVLFKWVLTVVEKSLTHLLIWIFHLGHSKSQMQCSNRTNYPLFPWRQSSKSRKLWWCCFLSKSWWDCYRHSTVWQLIHQWSPTCS